jgi:hypothetical protein
MIKRTLYTGAALGIAAIPVALLFGWELLGYAGLLLACTCGSIVAGDWLVKYMDKLDADMTDDERQRLSEAYMRMPPPYTFM